MILRDAIDHYVAWRRAHGARFVTSVATLHYFCKHAHCLIRNLTVAKACLI